MDKVAAKYVADDASEWQMLVGQVYYDQAELGWAPATPGKPVIKSNDPQFRPRVALCIDSSGALRRIVCGTKTATAYVTAGTSIDVSHTEDAIAYVATTYGYEGERRRFPVPAAPAQA